MNKNNIIENVKMGFDLLGVGLCGILVIFVGLIVSILEVVLAIINKLKKEKW